MVALKGFGQSVARSHARQTTHHSTAYAGAACVGLTITLGAITTLRAISALRRIGVELRTKTTRSGWRAHRGCHG